MSITLPSYFQSGQLDQDRRTTEQDEFNREVNDTLTEVVDALEGEFGDLTLHQTKEFSFEKTGTPLEDLRFRHNFGVIVTSYRIIGMQALSGGSASVEWPGRPADPIPTADVDDEEFVTLSFKGRGFYVIQVSFNPDLFARLAAGDLEGPS